MKKHSEKLWAVIFAVAIVVIGYIMVSSAAEHTQRDNDAMYQYRLNWLTRQH